MWRVKPWLFLFSVFTLNHFLSFKSMLPNGSALSPFLDNRIHQSRRYTLSSFTASSGTSITTTTSSAAATVRQLHAGTCRRVPCAAGFRLLAHDKTTKTGTQPLRTLSIAALKIMQLLISKNAPLLCRLDDRGLFMVSVSVCSRTPCVFV